MSPDEHIDAEHPSVTRPFPRPRFNHLRDLTDRAGLWEHAEFATPRVEHGFCTDDNARALVVVSRQAAVSGGLSDLAATYLGFVLEARTPSGTFHNRRAHDGAWLDDVGSDDSQGRAWWGLGTASHAAPTDWMRRHARDAFDACDSFESPHLRANAYAVLGAHEALCGEGPNDQAMSLIERTSAVLAGAARSSIPWPEDRLTYDNARIPDALLAAGDTLGDRRLTADGLRLLEWLVNTETSGDRFSFVTTVGWSVGEPRWPGFDQQPLEAWAMADACHRAWVVTGEERWRIRALRAARWLLGHNDANLSMYDRETGATFDGLEDGAVNQNRGAESTLAGIGTLQIAALVAAPPVDRTV